MFQVLTSLFVSALIHAAPNDISGTVTAAKGVQLKPGGVLFIIAKTQGQPMPVAVLRVPDPKLPYAFTLNEKNAMVQGTPFTGPFQITARFTETGDAMDKSGPAGEVATPVKVGTANVKIELKKK